MTGKKKKKGKKKPRWQAVLTGCRRWPRWTSSQQLCCKVSGRGPQELRNDKGETQPDNLNAWYGRHFLGLLFSFSVCYLGWTIGESKMWVEIYGLFYLLAFLTGKKWEHSCVELGRRGDNWRLSKKFNPSIGKYLIGGYFTSALC